MLETNFLVTVTADGIPLGTFDSFEGGDGDSEENKYPPGGMGDEESLGGRQTRDNFTVGRRYKPERDHPIFAWLDSRRGKAEIVASKQILDRDKNPFGAPTVYRGTLKKVSGPKHDSTSNDVAKLMLECTAAGGDLG